MASKCNRFINRASLSSLKSAIKSNLRTASASVDGSATSSSSRFSLPTRSTSSPLRRFSLSRPPSELGCVQSLLPLHSAVAAARMTSRLSSTSRSCSALSQGILCCTSPGL
ncbi:protein NONRESPONDING TO OXYLIPINS 2, mitochondrial-like isoform X1 [Actinidia eriantha]|uniref:protein NONRESPONDING TO OXYLIPINS 2, mitochondrial-like isoform X1 n=1 Tax=Actinidia eriantha TaxID=165200 RepID=UPI002590CC79|nr:protein NONRESPONDING TO OXYLIPINS 2, mitochondrial-like isoform X1 [Actinidia eriantha]